MLFRSLFVLIPCCILMACSSSPHRAEKIDTSLDHSEAAAGGEKLGVKDGNMVVQKKVMMSEELRRLQYEVYELEDRVYGNRKFGSKGLYGVLRDCHLQLADKKNGGDGKLKWIEPVDRVTDKEESFKLGVDENNKIVGVSEEFLKDRITRFKRYRLVLQKREDSFNEKIEICKADLKSRKFDMDQKKKNEE